MSQAKSQFDKPAGPSKEGQFTKIPPSDYTEWKSTVESFASACNFVQGEFNATYAQDKNAVPRDAMDDFLGNLSNAANVEVETGNDARNLVEMVETTYETKKKKFLAATTAYGAAAVAAVEILLKTKVAPEIAKLRALANRLP